MVDFHEVSLPPNFLYGATVDIQYKTAIVQTREGHEQRNVNWFDPLMSFNISNCIRDQDDLDTLIAFFRSRGGPKFGFRVKDFLDFSVTDEFVATGDGVTTVFQLRKEYSTGVAGDTVTEIRPITKPVDGTVTVEVDAVPTGVTLDATVGTITFGIAPGLGTTITWSGEFDVPVRFETEELLTSFEAFYIRRQPVSLIEVRIPLDITPQWTDPAVDDFVEARFFEAFSNTSDMGPSDNVAVVRADSGFENRITRWLEKRVVFNLKQNVQTLPEIQALRDIFRSKKGRAIGFRVKDISDFSVEDESFGTGDGATNTFQLTKTYVDTGGSEIRDIKKPVATPTIAATPATTITPTIDITEGTVTYTLGSFSCTFSDAGNTITRNDAGDFVADGVTAADVVTVIGSAAGNDGTFTIASVAVSVLTLDPVTLVDATETVELRIPPQPGVDLEWTGEFDVPVRFDTDTFSANIINFETHDWDNVDLIEIRPDVVPGSFLSGQTGKLTPGPTGCAASPLFVGDPGPLAMKFDGSVSRWAAGAWQIAMGRAFATTVIMVVSEVSSTGNLIHVPAAHNHETFQLEYDSGLRVTHSGSANETVGDCRVYAVVNGRVTTTKEACVTFLSPGSNRVDAPCGTPCAGGVAVIEPENSCDPNFPAANSDSFEVVGQSFSNLEYVGVSPDKAASGPGLGTCHAFRSTPVKQTSTDLISAVTSRVSVVAVTAIYTGDQLIFYGNLKGNQVGGVHKFSHGATCSTTTVGCPSGLWTQPQPGQFTPFGGFGPGSERKYRTTSDGQAVKVPAIGGATTVSTAITDTGTFFLHELMVFTHLGNVTLEAKTMIETIEIATAYLEFKWSKGFDPGFNPGPHLAGWWIPTLDTVFDADDNPATPVDKSLHPRNGTRWESINSTRFSFQPKSFDQSLVALVSGLPSINQSPSFVDMGEIKTIGDSRLPLNRPEFYVLLPGVTVVP